MTEQEFLKNYNITQYPQPSVAADIVLFTLDQKHTEKTIGLGPLQVLSGNLIAHYVLMKMHGKHNGLM